MPRERITSVKPDLRLRTSDFEPQTSDLRLRTSDFRLRKSDLTLGAQPNPPEKHCGTRKSGAPECATELSGKRRARPGCSGGARCSGYWLMFAFRLRFRRALPVRMRTGCQRTLHLQGATEQITGVSVYPERFVSAGLVNDCRENLRCVTRRSDAHLHRVPPVG